jgi:hypothetical protein
MSSPVEYCAQFLSVRQAEIDRQAAVERMQQDRMRATWEDALRKAAVQLTEDKIHVEVRAAEKEAMLKFLNAHVTLSGSPFQFIHESFVTRKHISLQKNETYEVSEDYCCWEITAPPK